MEEKPCPDTGFLPQSLPKEMRADEVTFRRRVAEDRGAPRLNAWDRHRLAYRRLPSLARRRRRPFRAKAAASRRVGDGRPLDRFPGMSFGRVAAVASLLLLSACGHGTHAVGAATAVSVSPSPHTQGAAPTAPTSAVPRPSPSSLGKFRPFVGQWTGHTRDLNISPRGIGKEYVSDGCCEPEVDITFRLVGTHQARADFVVTSFAYPKQAFPGPRQRFHLGERGTLILRGGVITDQLTQATFCDDAANSQWKCGA